jgi:hypothetical protein
MTGRTDGIATKDRAVCKRENGGRERRQHG